MRAPRTPIRPRGSGGGELVAPSAWHARLLRLALVIAVLVGCIPSAPPTVKIGLVAPFEGRYRDIGYDVIWAVRLAVREYNLARPPGGAIVELVAYDDGGEPAKAQEQVRKLAVDPLVLGAVGHWLPETTRAALEGYVEVALPLVTADDGHPYAYSLEASDGAMATRLVGYLTRTRRLGRLAIVGPETTLTQAISRTLALAGGQVVAQVQPGPAGEDDWVGRVRAAEPQVVFFSGSGVEAGDAALLLRAARVRAVWSGGTKLAEADFRLIAGPEADGAVIVTDHLQPADLPRLGDFAERYRGVAFGGAAPGMHAAPAYEAATLLLDAVRRAVAAGEPTRAGVARALRSARRDGLLGAVYFDAARRWPAAPVALYVVRDGRLVAP